MSIEGAFPLTPTISFISCGKFMFDLRVFDLHAHFQVRLPRKLRSDCTNMKYQLLLEC
jgi:hypothetical protein